jgi:hypothetical protein
MISASQLVVLCCVLGSHPELVESLQTQIQTDGFFLFTCLHETAFHKGLDQLESILMYPLDDPQEPWFQSMDRAIEHPWKTDAHISIGVALEVLQEEDEEEVDEIDWEQTIAWFQSRMSLVK